MKLYYTVSSTDLSQIRSPLDNITGENKHEKEYDFRQSGRYTNQVQIYHQNRRIYEVSSDMKSYMKLPH